MSDATDSIGYFVFSSLKEKDKAVITRLIETFKDIGKDKLMLKNAFAVWKRLLKHIQHLSIDEQYKIVYESTLIAYDARISAFDHINEFKSKLEEQ